MGRTLVLKWSLALLVAACSPTPSATPSLAPSVTPPSPYPTTRPTEGPSGSPSSLPFLDPETLAAVRLDESDVTAICDPDPSASGDVFCYEGLELGFRALRTTMTSVDRLYLNRPACASGVCVPDEVNRVRVIGWSGADAYTVLMDWDADTITVPIPDAAVAWPAATSSVPPPIRRPSIDNAPAEIRRREPYPFCGRAKPLGFQDEEPGDREEVEAINTCFFDGVLEGRPVEMIEIPAVTRKPALLRFDGIGFVTRYLQEGDGQDRGWFRREGSLVLGRSVYGSLDGPFTPKRVE